MENVLYLGVFLTSEARALLLKHFPPIHPEVHADHMTIKFKPSSLELENAPLNKKVRLRVGAGYKDEKGQVVCVTGLFSDNKCPHITISCNRERGGTPKYSNDILEKRSELPVTTTVFDKELILEGIIDTFPRSTTEQAQGEPSHG